MSLVRIWTAPQKRSALHGIRRLNSSPGNSRIALSSAGEIRTIALLLLVIVTTPMNVRGQARGDSSPSGLIQLTDVTEDANIDFVHRDGSTGQHYLIEAVASGLATFDFDLDGRHDIYLLNGAALKGAHYEQSPVNGLYRNSGNFRFVDATRTSGADDPGYALGVSAGDLNNDGFPDLYIANFGPNALYYNNGDGTFSPAIDIAVKCGNKVGAGVTFLDIENDGDLDIYAASYVQFEFDMRPPSKFYGQIVYGGPVLYPVEGDDLLRNNGDGTWTNISQESGILAAKEWGMGTLGIDYDSDGDTDLFVANDSTANFLWENDGQGNFEEISLLAGVAYDRAGDAQGSMGIDAADINGDLQLDIFQTAYENQVATLYENLGIAGFQDSSLQTGAGAGTYHLVNWGTAFIDLENDGDKDLVLANGHIHDNLDEFNDRTSYKIRNQVYESLGNGKFRDISDKAGPALAIRESSRGLAAEDLDDDGRVDLVIQNSRLNPTIIRNESQAGNYVSVRVIGTSTNRDAVGSQVLVEAGKQTQILEIHSGRGYQSHFGTELHFGVGSSESVNLTIRWLGGKETKIPNVRANQSVVVIENQGTHFVR